MTDSLSRCTGSVYSKLRPDEVDTSKAGLSIPQGQAHHSYLCMAAMLCISSSSWYMPHGVIVVHGGEILSGAVMAAGRA